MHKPVTPLAPRAPRASLAPLALLALVLVLPACGDGRAGPQYAEEDWSYPISQIMVGSEGRRQGEALAKALDLLRHLRKGAPFEELARLNSDDAASRDDGGFMGFVSPYHETRFSGAVQALPIGHLAGPVVTSVGYHILYRHPFEEGRRLEERTRIPIYGFFVTAREGPEDEGGRTKEQASQHTQEAWQAIQGGLPLAEAALRWGDQPPRREDAFLQFVSRRTDRPEFVAIYDAIKEVREGALAPPIEGPGGFAILRRGRPLRSIVRHILVRHVGSGLGEGSVTRTPEEAHAMAQRILRDLRPDGSNWSAMVERWSEDPETRPVDGSMGAVANGDLPPDLEAVILATPPGEVARRPAEGPMGVHLLWRVN